MIIFVRRKKTTTKIVDVVVEVGTQAVLLLFDGYDD